MIKKEHTQLVSIKRACELCKVSRSGFYKWLKKPVQRGTDVWGQKIKRIFHKSRKTYGTRRIKKQLETEGIVVSRKRIGRKMSEQGLVAKARRKTRATTNSNHDHPVAPNLLNWQFDVQQPNKALEKKPVTLKEYVSRMPEEQKPKADKILEINPKHEVFKSLQEAYEKDKEKLKLYIDLLYNQALLMEELPLEDPVEFANNICKVMG